MFIKLVQPRFYTRDESTKCCAACLLFTTLMKLVNASLWCFGATGKPSNAVTIIYRYNIVVVYVRTFDSGVAFYDHGFFLHKTTWVASGTGCARTLFQFNCRSKATWEDLGNVLCRFQICSYSRQIPSRGNGYESVRQSSRALIGRP